MRISDLSSDVCSTDLTLIDFRYTQHFKARRGTPGAGKNRTGAGGGDLVIKVPVGTQVISDEGEQVIADFVKAGQRLVLLRGGDRREEHTSELQSIMRNWFVVYCLKKKTKEKDKN